MAAIKVHDFYRSNNLRLVEIPVGVKRPDRMNWPNSKLFADDVQQILDSNQAYDKYGWVLDSSHVVIDIDTHSDSENGFESLSKLETKLGYSLESVCGAIVDSPSGGRHYYFSKPVESKFGKVFKEHYPGIDFINGHGKQVVAANSPHPFYSGFYTLTKSDGLYEIPSEIIEHLVEIRETKRPQESINLGSLTIAADRSGDEFNKSLKGLQLLIDAMISAGYAVRRYKDHFEFDRPGKTTDSKCSGFVGQRSKQGNYQLTCFSLADLVFPSNESMTIFHAYSLLCHRGDHKDAAIELYNLGYAVTDYGVDLSEFNMKPPQPTLVVSKIDEDTDTDEESFAMSMVPESGLIRTIFDYYTEKAQRRSNVIGLATSIAICETIMGRRIASHTDLRTNDYNVILAPTTGGKEACEETISSIFDAIPTNHAMMLPPDIQSGNGLMKSLSAARCGIWVSDEFGLVLREVLNANQRSTHMRDIGKYLLKLYGKSASTYGGAAHADGTRNKIIQPHLCVLGMTTGSTLFAAVTAENVSDGLFGRIAFWPVQNRPPLRKMRKIDPPKELIEAIDQWIRWTPSGNLGQEHPDPAILEMYPAAEERWESHRQEIDDRMNSERETRAAVWGRVAARSMKLALVHRAARIQTDPGATKWDFVMIEKEDIDWGIKLANWLANISCDLVTQNLPDKVAMKAASLLVETLRANGGEITQRALCKKHRAFTNGDFLAAAKELAGIVEVAEIPTKGRKRTVFKLVSQSA